MINALRVKYCKSILFNIFFSRLGSQCGDVYLKSILGAWIYMKNVGIYPKQFLVSKTRLYNRIPFQYIYNSTIFQKKNVSPSALSFVDWKENSLYLRPQSFKVSHEEFVHSLCTSASGCQHISLKLCIRPIHIKKKSENEKFMAVKPRTGRENPWKSNASFLAFHVNQMGGRVRKYWAWTEKERGGGLQKCCGC